MALGVEVPWLDKMTPGLAIFNALHISHKVWTSLLPSGGGIQPSLERGDCIIGNQLGFPCQVALSKVAATTNITREGVSAEVGAPHEVTVMEMVMLASMGATVMGKRITFSARPE